MSIEKSKAEAFDKQQEIEALQASLQRMKEDYVAEAKSLETKYQKLAEGVGKEIEAKAAELHLLKKKITDESADDTAGK